MSGPTVVIDRLSATLRHDPAEEPPAADRLRGPLRHAVDGALESALRGLVLPPGHWCLARLDLTLGLDLARPDPALARDWSEAVAAAIERTVREGRAAALVHYRHDVELLADAVAGLAAGRRERLWAWRQTGILRPGDPAPDAAPGPALLAALERHPQHAAAAVLRAAEDCGLAALDRAWGRDGWQRLAALAAGRDHASEEAAGPPPPGPGTRARARALLAGSRLAALVRESGLRPAGPTLAAWAVLVLAETDPASLQRPSARPGLRGLLADGLRTLGGAPALPDPEQVPQLGELPDTGAAAEPAGSGEQAPAQPADRPEAPPGRGAPPQEPPPPSRPAPMRPGPARRRPPPRPATPVRRAPYGHPGRTVRRPRSRPPIRRAARPPAGPGCCSCSPRRPRPDSRTVPSANQPSLHGRCPGCCTPPPAPSSPPSRPGTRPPSPSPGSAPTGPPGSCAPPWRPRPSRPP